MKTNHNNQPRQGTMMHQMKRFIIDGNNAIIGREEPSTSTLPEQKVDDFEFEVNQVYTVDVAMSTGEGKPRQTGTRTTVFKRAVDVNYRLKMKAHFCTIFLPWQYLFRIQLYM